ncbi:MAG: HAMP domain-containing histidine kinase [Planctomycetes bacterium]|nr:HAMP domain-containing histidine kinase [Planctomycetota bacterium]
MKPLRPIASLLALASGAVGICLVVAVSATRESSAATLILLAIAVGMLLAFLATGGLLLFPGHAALVEAATTNSALQVKVDGLRKRLEDLSSSQARFVGNVAHELKTPLATMLSHADELQARGEDPDAVRLQTKAIMLDIQHLSDLVDSFLRLARPFAHEDRSHHSPVFFHDCVTEAVRRSGSFARTNAVTFEVSLAEVEPLECAVLISGDGVLVEAMIENLLRNAVRFSPRGGRIELRVAAEGDAVSLTVRDHGFGMAPERLDAAFDWFFQDQPAAMTPSGHGFGLAIVKRIAEHHGGTIVLRNHPQGGCEFLVRLPRLREEESDALSESHLEGLRVLDGVPS